MPCVLGGKAVCLSVHIGTAGLAGNLVGYWILVWILNSIQRAEGWWSWGSGFGVRRCWGSSLILRWRCDSDRASVWTHRAGVHGGCGGFKSILSGSETALVLLGAALSLLGWKGLAGLLSRVRKAFMLSTDHIAETTVAEIAQV